MKHLLRQRLQAKLPLIMAALVVGVITGAAALAAGLGAAGSTTLGLGLALGTSGLALAVQDARPPAHGTLYAGALEHVPMPLILVSPERRIEFANYEARQFLERSAVGESMTTCFRSPAVLTAAEQVLAGGEGQRVEYSLLVPVERHLSAFVAPIDGGEGDGRVSVLITITDLTSQRRAERTQADFVANASHELRTPLSSLSGFIETLRGHARHDDAAREKFLTIMADQAARMRRLIDGLLSLSRIELYEHIPPTDTADLERAVERVCEASMPLAAAQSARIDVRTTGTETFQVIGDQEELEQVIQNLVSNALKYGQGRDITVELGAGKPADALSEGMKLEAGELSASGLPESMLQGYRYVRVRDYGEGIEREDLPRLTERFYRVSGRGSGSGLGLAIVKHVIKRHRGALTIESAAGQGSAFTVFVPTKAAAQHIETGGRAHHAS